MKATTGVVQWKRGGELEGRQNEEKGKLVGGGAGEKREPGVKPGASSRHVVLFLNLGNLAEKA